MVVAKTAEKKPVNKSQKLCPECHQEIIPVMLVQKTRKMVWRHKLTVEEACG